MQRRAGAGGDATIRPRTPPGIPPALSSSHGSDHDPSTSRAALDAVQSQIPIDAARALVASGSLPRLSTSIGSLPLPAASDASGAGVSMGGVSGAGVRLSLSGAGKPVCSPR